MDLKLQEILRYKSLYTNRFVRGLDYATNYAIRAPARAVESATAYAFRQTARAGFNVAKTVGKAGYKATASLGRVLMREAREVGVPKVKSAGKSLWENKARIAARTYNTSRDVLDYSTRRTRNILKNTFSTQNIARQYRNVFGDPSSAEEAGFKNIYKWVMSGEPAAKTIRTGGHPMLLRMAVGAGMGGLGANLTGSDVTAGAIAGAVAMAPRQWTDRLQMAGVSGIGLAAYSDYKNRYKRDYSLNVSGDIALGLHNLRHGA